MSTTDYEAAIARARSHASSYPEYAAGLKREGFTGYSVDVATHAITYRHRADTSDTPETFVERGVPALPPTDAESRYRFDASGTEAAIRANQRGETDYPGFLRDVWRSGIVRYDVDLIAGEIFYRGARDGEAHREAIPGL